MKSLIKIALLPCVAALTFVAGPVNAVTVSSSASAASSSQALSKDQIKAQKQVVKQARKLAKKCAKLNRKLANGKLKESKRASFSAKWNAMCKPAASAVDDANKPGNPVVDLSSPIFTGGAPGAEKPDGSESTNSDGPGTQAVPEPGSLMLLGFGLLGLGLSRRRAAK